jgi:hypothetical protein
MVQGFIFEGDLQFSKLFKNTIFKGVCTVKCTEKRFIPFTPPPFFFLNVPTIKNKGSPEYFYWNVLEHTSFRNYAPFSLQVPSILSILLGGHSVCEWFDILQLCRIMQQIHGSTKAWI